MNIPQELFQQFMAAESEHERAIVLESLLQIVLKECRDEGMQLPAIYPMLNTEAAVLQRTKMHDLFITILALGMQAGSELQKFRDAK